MKPEQIITKFKAGGHKIAIYFDDNSRYVMALERDANYGKEWAFTEYDKALAVAEWLCSLSDYQRDVVILGVQK
ncbi:MAG: hypothetical protein ACOYNY_41595 [Caldilineaceae bacterium]